METKTCRRVPTLHMAGYVPGKQRRFNILVCCFEGTPFEKLSAGYLLLMPYICVDESTGECTEQDHCLNSSCRFNKTTADTYSRYHDESEEYAYQLKKKWSKLIQGLTEFVGLAQMCKEAYFKDPKKIPYFWIEKGEIKKPPSNPSLLSNLKLSDLQSTEGKTVSEVVKNQKRNCQGGLE
jgi:hypothetical protein